MKRHAVATLFCLTASASAADPQPASRPASTQPATIADAKAMERADLLKHTAGLPAVGPFDMHQVLNIRLDNNRVAVTSPLESFDGERLVKFHHPDDSATINFHSMSASPAPDQPRFVQLFRYDFRDPKSVFLYTDVLAGPGSTQINATWQFLGEDSTRTVGIIDSEEKLDDAGGKDDARITLRVQGFDDGDNETHKIELTAPDLKTLQRKHPAEVNEYLRPVLREFDAESLLDIDPTLAWQLLAADARPDPKVVAEVNALLPKLDAANFADREQAAESLKKLGTPAAIAMLQLDRSKLSPEQNSRLEEALTSYHQLPTAQAENLAKDPGFLLTAMDSSDPELRRVAAARLAKLVGHPLDFDPAAAPEIRLPATDALRKKLTPPPTTHAVEKPTP